MPLKRALFGSILALALATGLSAQVSEPEKCGTPALLRPRPAQPSALVLLEDGGPDDARGRAPRGVRPVAGGVPTELPPNPTTPPQAPPASPPPPAVPGLSSGSGTKEERARPAVAAIQARGEVPEERLLDLGIEVFRPGDGDQMDKLAKLGLSPDVRRSEARYIVYHLRKTLESTGNWGAVRVVPGPGEGLDVTVSGTIVESNGKRLALEVEARDARGRRWLRKEYRGQADPFAYRAEAGARPEAFQEVYNRIANDLLRARDGFDDGELVTVRRVASLRFAAQLAPEAFAPYLKSYKDGRAELVRLPAEDDPMMQRVASIRERDLMFVDTLNDYYLGFYDRMSGPYADWRKNSYDEQSALDRINKESTLKKLLGGAAVLVGLLMPRDSRGSDMAGDVAVIGGTLALEAGFEQAKQKGIHETALKELANSFEADTTPMLVEVEGQQRELTGSAEAQFVAWRELLRQIFSVETGAPDDPNRSVAAFPPASR
ncbi:MAG TPA: hypothetical protein VFM88_09700 [Vicinamibacteria bacterium]|nr:hypothetical protein [Vicinamibacteria bacterium]